MLLKPFVLLHLLFASMHILGTRIDNKSLYFAQKALNNHSQRHEEYIVMNTLFENRPACDFISISKITFWLKYQSEAPDF